MFRPENNYHWHFVVLRVEDWLLKFIRDHDSPYWTWGQDLFWIAFLAAYPNFPHGKFQDWDSRIGFEWRVIAQCMPSRWSRAAEHDEETVDEDGVGDEPAANSSETGGEDLGTAEGSVCSSDSSDCGSGSSDGTHPHSFEF